MYSAQIQRNPAVSKIIAVSKIVSIENFNYIVDNYNNTYHRTIKSLFMYIKPIHRSLFILKKVHMFNLILKIIMKISNLKLVIM